MENLKIVELKVKKNVIEGKEYYYINLGSEDHFKKIWINSFYFENELRGIMNEYKEVLGVFRNARIEKTEKGNLVIKKGSNNLFFVLVKCGYRGSSKIEVLSKNDNVVEFDFYHSPRGNLGISSGAIISTAENSVKVRWSRSGRLYGAPSNGTSVIHVDGRIESVDLDLDEIQEIESI